MNSNGLENQLEILSRITRGYAETFAHYRDEFGLLDGQKWFEDLEFDYVFEVLLANFAILVLTCERIVEESPQSNGSDDSSQENDSWVGDSMPDYDMGYSLAEDCSSVCLYALELADIEVRSSLIEELYYAHVQYFNLSSSCNRIGFMDVNSRLVMSLIRLIQFQPTLMSLLNEWSELVQGFVDMYSESDDEIPEELQWRRKFIDYLYERLQEEIDLFEKSKKTKK